MVDTQDRARRSDAFPEQAEYRDDGCDMAPACLSCPFPRCRYDIAGGVRAMLNIARDLHIRNLKADGLTVDAIAESVGVSRRTVFRALAGR